MAPLIRIESVFERDTAAIVEVDSGLVSFGREPDNTVIIDSTAVSRHHGVLIPSGGHWVYRDLGSTNGTFLNDIPVSSGHYKLIKSGDLIRIANFTVRIVYLDYVDSQEPSLLLFKHDEFEREYFLSPGESFEAGGDAASIELDGENNNKILFCIYQQSERLYIQINELKGHLIINGTVGRGLVALGNGDQISVGLYKIVINYPISIPEMEGGIIEEAIVSNEVSAPPAFPDTQQIPVADGDHFEDVREPVAENSFTTPIRAYSRQTLHDHDEPTDQPLESDLWKNESARRKSLVGKKLVFGHPEEDDSGTLSMPVDEFQYHSGLNMSMSQRMSVVSRQQHKSVISEQVYVYIGALVLGSLIAVAWYYIW